MPEYEALVRRAMAARNEAESLQAKSRRISALARALREADAGRGILVRCAWCDRFKIDNEWLPLTAIGAGQQRIATSLRAQASHGICPDCLSRELEEAARAAGEQDDVRRRDSSAA